MVSSPDRGGVIFSAWLSAGETNSVAISAEPIDQHIDVHDEFATRNDATDDVNVGWNAPVVEAPTTMSDDNSDGGERDCAA